MPSIIYDFEEINKRMLGDDWMPRQQKVWQIETEKCRPIEKMPCQAAAPAQPYGQEATSPPPWMPPPPSIEDVNAAERQQRQRAMANSLGGLLLPSDVRRILTRVP